MKKYSLILFLLVSVIFVSCGKGSSDSVEPDPKPQEPETPTVFVLDSIYKQDLNVGVLHQKGHELKSLDVISINNLNADEKVLVSTLQGLAAKTSSEQIWLDEGGPLTVFLDYMKSKYGITVKETTLPELLSTYKSLGIVKGYILYDRNNNPRSVTAANCLCGPAHAIAVSKSIEGEVSSRGIKKMLDVSDKDEKWVLERYPQAFYKKAVAEQKPELNEHLRDYITLNNFFTFYEGVTSWRTSIMSNIEKGGYCFGGGGDEFTSIKDETLRGIAHVGTDMAADLAPLSSIYDTTSLKQEQDTRTVVAEKDVHYVAFMLTDGDNVAYDLWSMHNIFSSPIRGSFPVGYTISPSLYDLAPAALRWYLENKSEGDYFVCGPSGSGYNFPTLFPTDRVDAYIDQCDKWADVAGLRIINVIDTGGENNIQLWNKFLAKPNIDGIIYTGYGETANGNIHFADNGKPVIVPGAMLWGGISDYSQVIQTVNAKPTDPTKKSGYTLILVHVWSNGFPEMQKVVEGLNSNVRVVTPETLVKLIRQNVVR
jgi:uncharacterized protein YifE (UPF0438 family)